MKSNKRLFIEKWIVRSDILLQMQLRDQAEKELLEAIEKDANFNPDPEPPLPISGDLKYLITICETITKVDWKNISGNEAVGRMQIFSEYLSEALKPYQSPVKETI